MEKAVNSIKRRNARISSWCVWQQMVLFLLWRKSISDQYMVQCSIHVNLLFFVTLFLSVFDATVKDSSKVKTVNYTWNQQHFPWKIIMQRSTCSTDSLYEFFCFFHSINRLVIFFLSSWQQKKSKRLSSLFFIPFSTTHSKGTVNEQK